MHAPRGTSAAITTVLIALMTTGSVSTARGDANEGNVRLLAVQPDARCGGLAATLIGTEGPDRLRGTPEKDVIVGLGGRDQISGDGGNDVICGGGRSDVINPGRGEDTVYGQGGPDGFYPSPGADRIYGGGGDDFLTFGLGRDRLSGGPGNDAFFAPGGCLDLVSSCKIKGTATQVLRGGRGTDSVDYITFHGPINVDLRTGSVEGAGDDRLRGIENVRGTMRDDVLIGDAGPNELDGWAGNDLVRGLGGSDLLHLASLQVGERDRLS